MLSFDPNAHAQPWCGYIEHRYEEIRDDVPTLDFLGLRFPCLNLPDLKEQLDLMAQDALF